MEIAVALVLLIPISLASAQETPEKLFRALENQIAHAVITKDATQLTKRFASDYGSAGGAGQIWSKVEVIDGLSKGARAISAAEIEKITVRQYGDTAVVVGCPAMSGKSGDKGT